MDDPNPEAGQPAKAKVPASGVPVEDSEAVVDRRRKAASESRASAAGHRREMERKQARLDRQEDAKDGDLRRWKERWVLISVLLIALGVCLGCLILVFSPRSSDDLKKTALLGLFSLLTAALGYVAGKGGTRT